MNDYSGQGNVEGAALGFQTEVANDVPPVTTGMNGIPQEALNGVSVVDGNTVALEQSQQVKQGELQTAEPDDTTGAPNTDGETPTTEKSHDQWMREMDEKWPEIPEVVIGSMRFKSESELAAKLIEIKGIGKVISAFVAAAIFDLQEIDPIQYESAADFRWIHGIGPKRANLIAEGMGLDGIASESPADTEEQEARDEQHLDESAQAWEAEYALKAPETPQSPDVPNEQAARDRGTALDSAQNSEGEAPIPTRSAGLIKNIGDAAATGASLLAIKGGDPQETTGEQAAAAVPEPKSAEIPTKMVDAKDFQLESLSKTERSQRIAEALSGIPDEALTKIEKIIADAGLQQAGMNPDFQLTTPEAADSAQLAEITSSGLSEPRKSWLKNIIQGPTAETLKAKLKSVANMNIVKRLALVVALVSTLTLASDQGPIASAQFMPDANQFEKFEHVPAPPVSYIAQPDITHSDQPSEDNQPSVSEKRGFFAKFFQPKQVLEKSPLVNTPGTPQEDTVQLALKHGYGQYGVDEQRLSDGATEAGYPAKETDEVEAPIQVQMKPEQMTLEDENLWRYIERVVTPAGEAPNNQVVNAIQKLLLAINRQALGSNYSQEAVGPGTKFSILPHASERSQIPVEPQPDGSAWILSEDVMQEPAKSLYENSESAKILLQLGTAELPPEKITPTQVQEILHSVDNQQ